MLHGKALGLLTSGFYEIDVHCINNLKVLEKIHVVNHSS